jgi:hypothetical protein
MAYLHTKQAGLSLPRKGKVDEILHSTRNLKILLRKKKDVTCLAVVDKQGINRLLFYTQVI